MEKMQRRQLHAKKIYILKQPEGVSQDLNLRGDHRNLKSGPSHVNIELHAQCYYQISIE